MVPITSVFTGYEGLPDEAAPISRVHVIIVSVVHTIGSIRTIASCITNCINEQLRKTFVCSDDVETVYLRGCIINVYTVVYFRIRTAYLRCLYDY